MKKRIGIISICIALLPLAMAGQSGAKQEKPEWVNGYTHDAGNSYIESVSATGPTEDEARNKAAAIIIERRSLTTGQRVQVRVKGNDVIIDGKDELTVKAHILDEYREHYAPGEYRVSLLVQVAKNPELKMERVNVTPYYPFSPRVFVPGMAQLYKGSKAKGIMFIAGEAAFVGGIVVAESLRASYESKIGSTHNAATMQDYIDNADTWSNVRNVAIAGAAALYVWNIIDGIAAKGKKRIWIHDNHVQIMPYATPLSSGLTLNVKF
jgi:hypothetical protein